MNQLEINNMKKIKVLVTPWKRTQLWDTNTPDYVKGWNDCVEEVNKNYKKYVLPVIKEFQETK